MSRHIRDLIEHLLRSGNWTDAEIINLIGGNILRVLTDNENVSECDERRKEKIWFIDWFKMARELQKSTKPFESLISVTQLEIHNQTQCRHMDMYPSTQNNTVWENSHENIMRQERTNSTSNLTCGTYPLLSTFFSPSSLRLDFDDLNFLCQIHFSFDSSHALTGREADCSDVCSKREQRIEDPPSRHLHRRANACGTTWPCTAYSPYSRRK